MGGRAQISVVARAAVDYAPSPTDDSILQLPLKQELMPEDMTSVFGYPRDLRRRRATCAICCRAWRPAPACCRRPSRCELDRA